MYTIDESKKY